MKFYVDFTLQPSSKEVIVNSTERHVEIWIEMLLILGVIRIDGY